MNEKDIKRNTSEEVNKKSNLPKEKRNSEVSPEALEERQLLEGFLIERTDDLAKAAEARRKKREAEEIELRSGVKISIQQINEMVTAIRQPYAPMFPNALPFFKEMYRLLKWTDKDPDAYIKPAVVGGFINDLIYARYNRDVLPALQVLAMPGGVRLHKFFQFLTPEGQKKLEEFRDDAIRMMKDCSNWYEFRLKYGAKYGLPVQKKMFEANND